MTNEPKAITALDAIFQIAKAVEANAVALMGASNAVQEVVEHWRDMSNHDPFEGMTKQ